MLCGRLVVRSRILSRDSTRIGGLYVARLLRGGSRSVRQIRMDPELKCVVKSVVSDKLILARQSMDS